jgi:predicted ATPase
MKIEVNKCPYESDKKMYKYSELELSPGITILVGRNGCGKSTLR